MPTSLTPTENDLASYRKNIASQFGEDGIFEELFKRIGPERGGLCIEVGSWDGKYCSNTWNLWHNKGWKAVLIEGNPERHAAFVCDNTEYKNVTALCAFVETSGEHSLDRLLEGVVAPGAQLDLLSIDIDGDDYYIWESLVSYKPRVVVIEYNPTIPPHLSLIQESGQYFGASAKALVELGVEKGYRLVALTDTNCIFIRSELLPDAKMIPLVLQNALPPELFSYVMSAYDGTTILTRMPMFTEMDRPLRASRIPRFTGNPYPYTPVYIRRLSTPLRMFLRPGKRKLKKILEATGLLEPLRNLHEAGRAYSRLRVHAKKQAVLQAYRRQFKLNTLIETGTYRGDMVEAMRRHFARVHSIELGDALYDTAVARFADAPNVSLHHGDSGEILTALLPSLTGPALFWLDAHYSRGDTARGALETPIENELLKIFKDSNAHVILIDDARCFDGTHDYPTIEGIRVLVAAQNGRYSMNVAQDIIRITPH